MTEFVLTRNVMRTTTYGQYLGSLTMCILLSSHSMTTSIAHRYTSSKGFHRSDRFTADKSCPAQSSRSVCDSHVWTPFLHARCSTKTSLALLWTVKSVWNKSSNWDFDLPLWTNGILTNDLHVLLEGQWKDGTSNLCVMAMVPVRKVMMWKRWTKL